MQPAVSKSSAARSDGSYAPESCETPNASTLKNCTYLLDLLLVVYLQILPNGWRLSSWDIPSPDSITDIRAGSDWRIN